MAGQDARALLAGGGIGGLTAALTLGRVGFTPVVLEEAADIGHAQLGSGLHLWSNAMLVLRELGLDGRLESAGERLTRAEFVFWPGGKSASVDLGDLERRFGAPTIAVSRGHLHATLADALGPGLLRLGAACTGFEEDAESVTLNLLDGRTERGSFLVGTDGLNSTIRAQLLGDGPPTYAGYVIWRALVSLEDERIPTGTLRIVWGRGRRFTFNRIGGGQVYWSAVTDAPEGGGDASEGRKAGLLSRFGDFPEPTSMLIEATEEAAIVRTDNYDRKPVDRWGEGRVTLLGDAAHPMLFNVGQGACQTIEDAAVLARFLGREDDLPGALRAYEAARMPRTATLMTTSHRVGNLARWRNPIACGLRNAIQRRAMRKALVSTTTPADEARAFQRS